MKKRNVKKAVYAVCAAALLMNTAACAKGAAEETKVESSAETESREESSTGLPDESADEGTKEDSTEETQSGADESQGTGSETESAQEGTLEYVYQAVKKAYGDEYIPSMALDSAMLESMYGITEDMYDGFIGEVPMISAQIDSFIAVRAKEGRGKDVEAILEEYRKNLLENTLMYPMNMPVAKSSRIIREGDDVFFIMMGTGSALDQAETEEDMLKAAEQQTNIGVEAIKSCYGAV